MAETRFLIVRLGALGDVVHAIPVAAALRERFPEARIDWLVDPRYVGLVRLVPAVTRAVPVDPRGQWTRLGATLRDLRRARYDAAIDLQGLLKSAVLARLAGAARTVGFSRVHLREPAARFFYSETETPPAGAVHVVRKNLALIRSFGLDDDRPVFGLDASRAKPAERVAAVAGAGDYALIVPGAGWPNKRWPAERFGALAAALRARRGLRSVVLWGPGEVSIATAVVGASGGAAELAPPTTIPDLVALARGAAVMVGGDTGPLHVGAAAGTPVVAIFGPSRAERNGPWLESDIVVSRTAECECLYERRCRRAQACIDDIGLGEVLAAVELRLAASAAAREAAMPARPDAGTGGRGARTGS